MVASGGPPPAGVRSGGAGWGLCRTHPRVHRSAAIGAGPTGASSTPRPAALADVPRARRCAPRLGVARAGGGARRWLAGASDARAVCITGICKVRHPAQPETRAPIVFLCAQL